uniref:Uncharacterized protein n=1 Tax=uncultured marine virus TaxID=186617 RepID=A0A0F7L507_9VIRU|nr:hypothetical protein [uncultured marine virus]
MVNYMKQKDIERMKAHLKKSIPRLDKYEIASILNKTRELLQEQKAEFREMVESERQKYTVTPKLSSNPADHMAEAGNKVVGSLLNKLKDL